MPVFKKNARLDRGWVRVRTPPGESDGVRTLRPGSGRVRSTG